MTQDERAPRGPARGQDAPAAPPTDGPAPAGAPQPAGTPERASDADPQARRRYLHRLTDLLDTAAARTTPGVLVAALCLAVAALAVVTALVTSQLRQASATSAAVAAPTTATPTAVASPAPTPGTSTPTASAPPQPGRESAAVPTRDPSLTYDEDGMPRSGLVGDGTWTVAEPVAATGTPRSGTRTYLVRVEGGVDADPTEVARTVDAVLNDDRGWLTVLDLSFQQVSDPAQAQFTVSVASPSTTDQLCAPLETASTWSCNWGNQVVLNSDRWLYLVPWIPDAEVYHAYLVNHEVGHWLGYGHHYCAGEGLNAPTMMQQSKGLAGCRANPWPTLDHQPG